MSSAVSKVKNSLITNTQIDVLKLLREKDAVIANTTDVLEWSEFLKQLPHFLKQSSYRAL